MIVTDFLERLTEFVEDVTKEQLLPVMPTKTDPDPAPRAAEVHWNRLPDSKSYKSKAPYILVQVLSFRDYQYDGQRADAECTVRMVFCTYCEDETEGTMYVLNMIQDVRERLLRYRIIGSQYELQLGEGMEATIYTEDSAPFYGGELISVWRIPTIVRESRPWLDNVSFPLSPSYSG